MPTPPVFSTVSAVTELAVTAAVFYVIFTALRHDVFKGRILAIALTYEVLFNVSYMTLRLFADGGTAQHPGWMTALFAVHGILSLIMLVGLIAMGLAAFRVAGRGRNLFREQPQLTWAFVVLWSFSILSGEAIYVLQYSFGY